MADQNPNSMDQGKCMNDCKRHHGKWIFMKVVILLLGIAIGFMLKGHWNYKHYGFENNRFNMMNNNMMHENMMFDKKMNQNPQKMQKMGVLEDDFKVLQKIIHRGDLTGAQERIDLVSKELATLKTNLPMIFAEEKKVEEKVEK